MISIVIIAAGVCALTFGLLYCRVMRERDTYKNEYLINDEAVKEYRKVVKEYQIVLNLLHGRRDRTACFEIRPVCEAFNVVLFCESDSLLEAECLIKKFHYNPTDAEDMAFARREAEELIDKLNEK